MVQGRNTFTAAQMNRLKQLFIEKDKACSSQQKRIRKEMRKMEFYITDFCPQMNYNGFIQLLESSKITVVDSPEKIKPYRTIYAPSNADLKKGLAPWVDEKTEILLLGSLPGDASIKKQTYYQNKSKNSFWRLMHGLLGEGPKTKEFLLQHHIALWDCLAAANREGSLDANFTEGEVQNKIPQLLASHPNIKRIVLNGSGAPKKYFDKYFYELYDLYDVVVVPSSSNARAMTFEEKLQEWKRIFK